MKKSFTLFFILIFSIYFSQNKFTKNYTLFSILKSNDLSEIKPTKASIVYDFIAKKITVNKLDGQKEIYKIISKAQNSQASNGEKFLETIATDGNYDFLFRFLENRVMIINTVTRNGLILYR